MADVIAVSCIFKYHNRLSDQHERHRDYGFNRDATDKSRNLRLACDGVRSGALVLFPRVTCFSKAALPTYRVGLTRASSAS